MIYISRTLTFMQKLLVNNCQYMLNYTLYYFKWTLSVNLYNSMLYKSNTSFYHKNLFFIIFLFFFLYLVHLHTSYFLIKSEQNLNNYPYIFKLRLSFIFPCIQISQTYFTYTCLLLCLLLHNLNKPIVMYIMLE